MHISFYNQVEEDVQTAIVPTHAVDLADNLVIVLSIHCDDMSRTYFLKGQIIDDVFGHGILVAIMDEQVDRIALDSCPSMIDFSIVDKDTDTLHLVDCNENVGESIINQYVHAAYNIQKRGEKWTFSFTFDEKYNKVTEKDVSGFKICLNVDPQIIFNDS